MENQEKAEKSEMFSNVLNELTSLENWANGKMVKTKKSQDFLKPPLFSTNSQRKVAISTPSAQKVIEFLLYKSKNCEMALHFVNKSTIAKIHKEYFDDPTPTDCITFPFKDPNFLGEVYVCPEVALEYISLHGGNLYEEITLYIVHGFLHLLGWNDQTESEKKKMRSLEKKWMKKLAKNKLTIRACV